MVPRIADSPLEENHPKCNNRRFAKCKLATTRDEDLCALMVMLARVLQRIHLPQPRFA